MIALQELRFILSATIVPLHPYGFIKFVKLSFNTFPVCPF